mgnify:CR=1 FL=1
MKQIQIISEYYKLPIETVLQMSKDGLLDNKTINRTLSNILIDKYVDKHKNKVEAMKYLAQDLEISEHTVQAFIYNNRNNTKYTCKKCGSTITAYYHYQKNDVCKKCSNK